MFKKNTLQSLLMIVLMVMQAAVVHGATFWFDRSESAKQGHLNVEITQPGEYQVWVWANRGSDIDVIVSNMKSVIPPKEGEGAEYTWRQGETINLRQQGSVNLSVRENGQRDTPTWGMLVLTTDSDYDPEQVSGLFQVFREVPDCTHDRRCDSVRRLRQFMEFERCDSLNEWEQRAANLRSHIKTLLGLNPPPHKCPLNPNITGRVERDGYSIEKVTFESWPGFLVTGNLYRPLGKKGPFPGIVSPHGHWGEGRLADDERGSVPARCINFARQGYVIFSYDMVGYVDSCQLPHGYGQELENLWGLSVMGVHTWNSIRAIDFVQSLPDVDAERIGVTGASGGGTQTFMLYAVDDRPKVAAPVNMISGRMQGGCICENAPLLRIEHNNIEIGALFAPKPLFMVSCTGDWTDETPFNEYPNIRSIYRLYDADNHLDTTYVDAGHNYNRESREAVYTWFMKWLMGKPDAGHVSEEPYNLEPDEVLRIFPNGLEGHPFADVTAEKFTAGRIAEMQTWLDSLDCNSEFGLAGYRKLIGEQWPNMMGGEVPDRHDLHIDRRSRAKYDGYQVNHLILGRKGKGDRVPATLFIPTRVSEPSPATIIVHPDGKRALADIENGQPRQLVQKLLEQGHRVLGLDTFLTGEYHSPLAKTERNRDESLFTAYNYTDTACRVQDILTAVAYLFSRTDVSEVNIVGLETSGVDVALAKPLAPQVSRIAVDLAGLDLSQNDAWLKHYFVPCLRRLGDIRSALILSAPAPCLVQRAKGVSRERIDDAYASAGAENNLTWSEDAWDDSSLAEWLND